MTDQHQESPFKPLWKKPTQAGRERYTGVLNIDGREYWLNVFPNTSKRNPKQPDFHYSISPKEQGESR